MAWKKYRKENQVEDMWVSLGKEKEGYLTLREGQSIEGYFERLTESEKFDRPILSILNFDKSLRYLLFAPPQLTKIMEDLEQKYGTGIAVRLTYLGKKEYKREDGEVITYHAFDAEYDEENRL